MADEPQEKARRPRSKAQPVRSLGLKIWERQPWENEGSHHAFFVHYLMQEKRPRSATEAFRRYATEKGLSLRLDKRGRTLIPDYFRAWLYGTDGNGERPEGSKHENALSWEERARLHDRAVTQEMEEAWRSRQQALREEEWAAGNALLERAQSMMDRFDIDATEWDESAIAKHIETGVKLKRRAAGLPDRVENAKQWRMELKQLGLNPDEVLEIFTAAIAQDADGDPDAGTDQ